MKPLLLSVRNADVFNITCATQFGENMGIRLAYIANTGVGAL